MRLDNLEKNPNKLLSWAEIIFYDKKSNYF